ncbi:hypothetical protein FRB97_001590 [Tulasnella sp. 331]|nr:hypothetical protein FRB97_001590 [Tulasnella sp. 331]
MRSSFASNLSSYSDALPQPHRDCPDASNAARKDMPPVDVPWGSWSIMKANVLAAAIFSIGVRSTGAPDWGQCGGISGDIDRVHIDIVFGHIHVDIVFGHIDDFGHINTLGRPSVRTMRRNVIAGRARWFA